MSRYYFLVNNDYHIDFILGFIKSIPNYKILLKAPVSITSNNYDIYFDKIEEFEFKEFNSIRNLIFKSCSLNKKKKILLSKVKPKCEDVLFLNTDMFLLNHLIVSRFIKNNCRIYLLEDGAATMTYFNINSSFPGITFIFKKYILRYLYNLNYTNFRKFDHEIMPILDDKIFKGLIVNLGNSTNRNIKIYKIKLENTENFIKNDNSAIFYNQPLYNWYCDFDSYLIFIKEFIETYSKFCEILYIKYHPGDIELFKNNLRNFIEKNYQNVTIIEENINAEQLIFQYPVKHAITINSTSVLNLLKYNCNPIFLNYIFNTKFPNKTSSEFNNLLFNIGCDFPIDFQSINGLNEKYYYNVNNNTLGINQIIND
jgi:hypothetical protein